MPSSLCVAAAIPAPFETAIVDEEVEPIDFDCDTDRDWSHHDFSHVVFDPMGMSSEGFLRGHNRVLRNFYARSAIAARAFR